MCIRLAFRRGACFGLAAAAVAGWARPASAITLGQRDQFAVLDSGGWIGGAMTGVLADGGLLGAGDAYLRVVGDGGGPNGKLTVHNNTERWLGNYVGAGVTRLEMDLKNFSAQPLTIRIAFKQFTGQGVPGYVTSNLKAIALPADGQWHHAGFDLRESDMVPINGPFAPLADLLSGGPNAFQELRILHSASPTLQGDNVAGAFGIDNVTAVPTPAASGLLAFGIAAIAGRRRTRV